MKKFYFGLLALLTLLLAVPVQQVEAGVGNSKSGGSVRSKSGGSRRRRSSGGYYRRRYRSSYSSSESSSSGSSAGYLVIVGAVGLLAALGKGAKNALYDEAETPASSSYHNQWLDQDDWDSREIVNNSRAISRLKQEDPAFDEDRFISYTKKVYLKLQSAWTDKDWESVRSLESASLFEQHKSQLQEYIRSQTTNVLERVRVENVKIKNFYANPNGYDTLVVILSSTLRDYIRDDQSQRIIEGDPSQELFTVYQLNFIRPHGSQTQTDTAEAVSSDSCPNCGAPLTAADTSQCGYCGAAVSRTSSQWLLDTYDVVNEDEFYN